MTVWTQPRTPEEVEAVLNRCAVRREPSATDPWYMIEHEPTGQRISTVALSRRRWRSRQEAEAALAALREIGRARADR